MTTCLEILQNIITEDAQEQEYANIDLKKSNKVLEVTVEKGLYSLFSGSDDASMRSPEESEARDELTTLCRKINCTREVTLQQLAQCFDSSGPREKVVTEVNTKDWI